MEKQTVSVDCLPGNVFCGKCGWFMATRNAPTSGSRGSITIYCGNERCENYGVDGIFILERRILQCP